MRIHTFVVFISAILLACPPNSEPSEAAGASSPGAAPLALEEPESEAPVDFVAQAPDQTEGGEDVEPEENAANSTYEGRWILLILDASGSMQGKLMDGQTKVEAARLAVEQVGRELGEETRVAFRAYGHQSHRTKHDCEDTQLLVPFGRAGDLKAAIIDKSRGLVSQGYTPISRALQAGAADFPKEADGERVIILVSDGKETCDGDPCALARALAKAEVSLIIHTVGLGVDEATRFQLSCIAEATGGSYWDAGNAEDLADSIASAVDKKAVELDLSTEPGNLELKNPDNRQHDVINAETGEVVGSFTVSNASIRVPPGTYNVTFGEVLWKSIQVKPRKTTVIEAGALNLAMTWGSNFVLDAETGQPQAEIGRSLPRILLIPGVYDLTFGNGAAVWPAIRVEAGKEVTVNPGILEVENAVDNIVRTREGVEVGVLNSRGQRNIAALPPGEYTVEIAGKQVSVSLLEGQKVVLKNE